MRIVIDLQVLQGESRFRGMGRYSFSLACAMIKNAARHEVWIALNGAFPERILEIREALQGIIPAERIRIFDIPTPASEIDPDNSWRVRAAEIMREDFLKRLQPDIVHIASLIDNPADEIVTSVGCFTEEKIAAATLYDLIPYTNPAIYLPTRQQKEWYSRKIESLKKSQLILAISEHSRSEAINHLQIPEHQIVNISGAVDSIFRHIVLTQSELNEIKQRYGISRDMILYVPGGFDSRKNFDRLIEAFVMLPANIRSHHQLVIASKISAGDRHRLEQLGRKWNLEADEMILTGYVDDEDLPRLYNMATLFVFPSLQEGFGLPVLESMACGTPTIGSNSTSIPEVIGWDNALFDPTSAQAIAEKIVEALGNNDFREKLRLHAIYQTEKFSWDISAKRALTAFEQLHEAKSRNSRARLEIDQDHSELINAIKNIPVEYQPRENDLAKVARAVAFNSAELTPRQFLLDVSTIVHQDAKSGIQRVVRSIAAHLLTEPPPGLDVKLIYFQDNQYYNAARYTAKILGKSEEFAVDDISEMNQDDIYLALDLNMHLAEALHPLHLRMKCIGVYLFYIVYDILLIQRPDWWPNGLGEMFTQWLKFIASTATGLVCISKAVSDDVKEWITLNHSESFKAPIVSSFHLGADVQGSLPTGGYPENSADVLRALKSKPSFLMVGTIEPRKGYGQALAAFELLWKCGKDISFVIVGKQGWLVDKLIDRLRNHPERNKRLFWMEGISDEYLEAIYANCTCLIAASEGEGFGLPLIEAAQHKLPLIARDLPVFREVAKDHALFFSGLEPAALASAIEHWLSLHSNKQVPSSHDLPWLTWRQSVEQLVENIIPVAPSAELNNGTAHVHQVADKQRSSV